MSFVDLWQRIANAAVAELRRRGPDDVAETVLCDLTRELVARLSTVGEPVLWEEFTQKRTLSDIVNAHTGEPRRQIYCAFLEELRRDGLLGLTATYPVLRRHLATTVDQWLRNCEELLTRVHGDRELLQQHFGLPVEARLTGTRLSLSDPHRRGHTVALLTFAHPSRPDEPYLLVYKPKHLGMDEEFQRLLSRLPPARAGDGPLRSRTVLPCGSYGYMEHVPHRLCTTEHELRSFYRNAGRLTAVLHLLGCTDCHHENLIASGDQLELVDAETLFEGTDDAGPPNTAAPERSDLHRRFTGSVVRLGLLPEWHFLANQPAPRDVSALGISPPTTATRTVPGWIALNSDGMLSAETEQATYLPTSSPVGVGAPNRLGDFVDDFCDGFEGQLRRIAENAEGWLGLGGHLARFRGRQRRFIARPTWLYLWLRNEQVEPDAMRSEAVQRVVLERLARSYLVAPERPQNWPLLEAEVAQMNDLDIPIFDQSVDDATIRAPDGTALAEHRATSGYHEAHRRVRLLDPGEIDFQCRVIRGVVAARTLQSIGHAVEPSTVAPDPVNDGCPDEERLDEARTLGELVLATSVTDENGAVEWLGIDVAQDLERARYGPLGPGLYGGRSGIALFLAALAGRDQPLTDRYRRAAVGACADLRHLLRTGGAAELRRWWRDQPLGLAGSGGILLALLHLREVLPLGEDGLAPLVEALDTEILRADRNLDIVNGCAGLIGPLLRIGSSAALSRAREAGGLLVDRQDTGGGWVVSSAGTTPLTGFSHGTSGIAAALARLFSATGGDGYLDAADRGLRYERACFDRNERNWPDFRGAHDPANLRFMRSWCHGAPGVALARLCLTGTPLWDAAAHDEVVVALDTTARPDLAGDSVCCGRFGRAAILRFAASLLAEPTWAEAAGRLEAQSLAARRANGAYSFLDRLGLFTGAAGAGLALLDATAPDESVVLPSILSAGLGCGDVTVR